MTSKICTGLEELAKMAARSSTDAAAAAKAIQAARAAVADGLKTASGPARQALEKLDGELGIWQSKLSVILAEPVGRQGMVKHAAYWVEQLKRL